MEQINSGSFVEFRNVRKVYQMGEVRIEALHDVNFTIEKGEICVIVGPSGAGKTTLLNILGGMDRLTSGHVLLEGTDISAFSKRELASYRRYDVGFVFQFYNLIQNLTAIENVELATQICREPLDPMDVMEQVGLLFDECRQLFLQRWRCDENNQFLVIALAIAVYLEF